MRRFTRILCPIDFSGVSRHALDHAVMLARWYDASITGLYVYTPVFAPTPGFGSHAYAVAPVVEQVSRTDYERDVLSFIAHAGAQGIDVSARVEIGRPAQQIVSAARSLNADLIVMGTHGSTGFEHLMLGSIAETVLRHSPVPVMTVPPPARTTSSLPLQHVLCPIDFSIPSAAALAAAVSIAQEGDAKLTILHVADVPTDEPLTTRPIQMPEYYAEYDAWAREQLEALVTDDMRDRCRPVTRIRHGKAWREILWEAAERCADAIVIGLHGRHALNVTLFGSTTNQVVRRATCAVMTVRS